jgi:hypothetical protein
MKPTEVQKCDQSVVLNEVAEEQKLKLEYLDYAPQPDESKCRAVVSLCLQNRVIYLGSASGIGVTQARKSAAYDALEYLRHAGRN